MSISGPIAEGSYMDMVLKAKTQITGEWTLYKDNLYIKTIDGNVNIKNVKLNINGEDHTNNPKMSELKQKMSDILNRSILKGKTNERKILLIDESKYIFQTVKLEKTLTITANKLK